MRSDLVSAAVGRSIGIKNAAISLALKNEWQTGALDAIEDDLFVHQTALTQRVLTMCKNKCLPIKLIEQWIDR